jgi:serine/threonine protein kinase
VEFAEACILVNQAKSPVDLFGPYDGEGDKIYKDLVKLLHPDLASGSTIASEAFQRLTELFRRWVGHSVGFRPFELSTKTRTYSATHLLYEGDLSNIYLADRYQLKMVRSPKNNDLMQAEAAALKTLNAAEHRFQPFLPYLVESVRHRDIDTHMERRVNVLGPNIDWYSLGEVHERYPNLHPKDAAWMWRRLLIAIGIAAKSGIVHGAVVPENILIQPQAHGLKLIDWCYSSTGSPIKGLVSRYKAWYPQEILSKEAPTEATDIYLATRTMEYMLGRWLDEVPPLRAFIKGCALERASMRPQDAWALKDEFDDLLERMWGVRRYRPFSMT